MKRLLNTIVALVLVACLAVPLAMTALASPGTVTLNPDGAGDQTPLGISFVPASVPPALRSNWGVNTLDDGDTSYVHTNANEWLTDLYSIENPATEPGTIDSVTVFIKARAEATPTQASARTAIKTGGTIHYGTPQSLGTTYGTYSTAYSVNPTTSQAWTWSEVSALQAGVSLSRAAGGGIDSRCTQVWVVVAYSDSEPSCDWIGETAWAAGDRYVESGNWATYTAYVADSTVTLYAGQTLEAGTVHFSGAVDGEVTITVALNPGWRFKDVGENVKVQDYDSAPSGNPAPGLFAHKGYATASSFSIDVPQNSFYGVHVNVEWEHCSVP